MAKGVLKTLGLNERQNDIIRWRFCEVTHLVMAQKESSQGLKILHLKHESMIFHCIPHMRKAQLLNRKQRKTEKVTETCFLFVCFSETSHRVDHQL